MNNECFYIPKFSTNIIFKNLLKLLRLNNFKRYDGRKTDKLEEFFFIENKKTICIKKTKNKIIITELPQLSEEFVEELKSGNVTSSIIGI